MTDFIIKKLPYDLTSNAGLALVGQYVKRLGVSNRVDRKFPVGIGGIGGIANSDILKSYLGLLVQGKNDFDAVEEFRGACQAGDRTPVCLLLAPGLPHGAANHLRHGPARL